MTLAEANSTGLHGAAVVVSAVCCVRLGYTFKMSMVYLIGGAPRVGKTKLALRAVGQKPMFALSTDAVRASLRVMYTAEQKPALFALLAEEQLPLAESIAEQNAESRELWPAIKAFIHSNYDEGHDVLVEGIGILPALLSELKIPYKAVFVGNTAANHVETIREHARAHNSDWLHGRDDSYIESIALFVAGFSESIRAEAEKCSLPYVDIRNDAFERSQDEALRILFGIAAKS